MSVRIRVYPQYGGLGMNGLGMNGMGGAVSAATYYNNKLQTQKQVSNLQLGYERALWSERLDKARLEERLKNPYLGMQTAAYGAYGGLPVAAGFGGLPGMAGFGGGVPMGMPVGGMPMGGIPAGFGGSGQTNITNQTSTGAGNQTVSNVNTNNVSSSVTPPAYGGYGGFGGWGGGGFGGGGLISGLLGALI
jgi:hypothetical protein